MRRYITVFFIALSTMIANTAYALTANQTVEKEVTRTLQDGTTVTEAIPAEEVLPGETVIYTLLYENDEPDPISNFKLVMPVPAEMTYIEGTATETGFNVEYSTDGGKSYMSREALKVRGEDGMIRTASAADINSIRWGISSELVSGATGQIKYKAVLK